jgi:uncharacterized protein DUF3810
VRGSTDGEAWCVARSRALVPVSRLAPAAAVVAAAIAAAVFRPPAPWVEAHFVNGWYLSLDPVLRGVVDLVPFAVGDVLLAAVLAALLAWWVLTLRRSGPRLRRLAGLLAGTAAVVAVVYIWFVNFWGLCYDRVPVADKVVVDAKIVDAAHVDAFANRVVRMLSENVDGAHREWTAHEDPGPRLVPQFEAAIARLGDERPVAMPVVKPTIFDRMLATTGDAGFMDPWTHEVNVYSGLLFFERPAVFAHEWAHVAGFADESEANYIATLTCIGSPSALARYSGWLLVWENLPEHVHVTQHVKPQVIADIKAIRARLAREVKPAVARAQEAAYDRYLRANRVASGIESYHLFIRWMTGATYDAHGLPLVRAAATSGGA